MPSDRLLALLAAATLQVQSADGPQSGTAFCIAPQLALTSAHLVGRMQRADDALRLVPGGGPIQVRGRYVEGRAELAAWMPELDLAVLRLPDPGTPCVFIQEFQRADRLRCFGFPPGATAGSVQLIDVAGWSDDGRRIELSGERLGRYTGAPLFDERSGGVCGVLVGAQAVDRERLRERIALLAFIVEKGGRAEFEQLAFEAGVSTEQLPYADGSLAQRTIGLIRYLDDRGQLDALRGAVIRLADESAEPYAEAVRRLPEPIQDEARRVVEESYREELVYGVGMSSLLALPDLFETGGLAALQREFHGQDTRWVDSFNVEQRRSAGPCYPKVIAPPAECPYPGLGAYSDSRYFFGREGSLIAVERLLRVREQRLVVITGRSGAGKSSLLRAGLRPLLQQGGEFLLAGGDVLRLKQEPLARLREALGLQPDDGAEQLAGRVAELLRGANRRRLVLLIDQFEELLLAGDPAAADAGAAEAERSGALQLLSELRKNRDVPATIVLAVQSEELDSLKGHELSPLSDQIVRIDPLEGQALREAIIRPAAECGVDIELALVETLVAEARADATANPLPMLQVALETLWDRMRDRTLRLDAYHTYVGSLAEAIQRYAVAVIGELPEAQQRITRNMVLRLVELHDRRDRLRPELRSKLLQVDAPPRLAASTLDLLVKTRLVVADTYRGVDWVELAHQALLIHWQTLRDEWLKLRACELERREWEREVERYERSAHERLLTDRAEIERAAQWDGGCGRELGAVPGLAGLVERSRDALERRARTIRWSIFLLVTVMVVGVGAFYLFALPLLPK